MGVLALTGGYKAGNSVSAELFKWPIVTAEDENAVIEVLRAGSMSGTDITQIFEKEYAQWTGVKYALGCCNGTAALTEALWACGVGAGDEVIGPSMTYWASATPVVALGGTVNFADIDCNTLCIDPTDIEHRIGPRTKAIVVVHYAGYPCDMDAVMDIAARHDLKVVEDVSHAQGGLYKGRKLGSIGHIAGTSLMAGKALVAGEGGMVTTNDQRLFDRCVAFGHYERLVASNYSTASMSLSSPELLPYVGVPLGGVKHRMNQTCSAMGRVQLRNYPERCAEIQKAMNYLWDNLSDLPGIKAHRPASDSGSTMGGWYLPKGIFCSEELDGLSCKVFCAALTAEGLPCRPGANTALHRHRWFHDFDVYGHGKPSVTAFAERDVRQDDSTLPNAAHCEEFCFTVPWFKKYIPEEIDQYIAIYRKVLTNYRELLSIDPEKI